MEAPFMKPTALFLSLALLAAPAAALAQSPSFSSSLIADKSTPGATGGQSASPLRNSSASQGPFSRVAIGGGFSPLGINLLLATNLGQHMNLRATGNVFNYTASNISTNGFNVDAKLYLASAGVSLDLYPFPKHGFHVSPGVLFYNTNKADATFNVVGGTSFTLDNYTYYASTTNPVRGTGTFGLHSQNPAFTITGGWGNVIPHKGGHWSYPVEVGVALIGAPTVNIALTQGQVCDANGFNCVNVATDQDVQTNLQAQIAKYKSNLDPLKTYPIVSFGVAFAFHVR
jgi:hypothetical protein